MSADDDGYQKQLLEQQLRDELERNRGLTPEQLALEHGLRQSDIAEYVCDVIDGSGLPLDSKVELVGGVLVAVLEDAGAPDELTERVVAFVAHLVNMSRRAMEAAR